MYPRKLTGLMRELLGQFRILYLTGPHGLIQSYEGSAVVLDEFQYAPGLIPAIKAVSDDLPPEVKGKFLLTGSADIFRSAKVQESLPGHMARLELYPLSLSEISGATINLIDYLIAGDFRQEQIPALKREEIAQTILLGGYPEVQGKSSKARNIWFQSYIEGRLFKDFANLYTTRGDYHSRLQALTPYLAGLSGNLIKYANIANDLLLDDKLVKNYIEILELMFIIRRVPAWLKNRAKRQATQMPKLHFIDTGLASYLLGLRTPEQLISSQFYGGLLETLVYMECCKQATWADNSASFYHFRDTQKNEVDLVLEQDNGKIIGIEIKASASVSIQDFKGLNALADYAGEKFRHGILFYTGKDILPFTQGTSHFYALPIGLLCR
ncbi:MAG: ATP-binding protein [Cellvibrio sp.]|nr:ATP-binding protein [Cellvibrio sp.]